MKTKELKRHEIVEIVSDQLGSHAGGDAAALLSALFHAQAKNHVRASKLTLLKDTSITFRTLKQAISVARTWLDRGEQLFTAVVWGLWRTYAAIVKEDDDLKWLYESMLQTCNEARSLSLVNLSESRRDKRILTPFQRESRELRIVFASFIHVVSDQIVTHFMNLQDRNEFREAMKSFLDVVFTKIYPEEKEACQELQNHLDDCHGDMKTFQHFCSRHRCCQLRRITEHISETKKMTVNEYIIKDLTRLIAMYKEFRSNATFSDWQQRRSFLEDTCEVLRSLIDLADGNPHCQDSQISSMISKAKTLLCVRHLTHYFRAFEKDYFIKSVHALHELQNRCQNKALKFALQKELSKKVTDSGSRLRDSIAALRDSSITKREENHLVLCFSLAVLDWKTSLRLHERLVLMHRAHFSAGEVLKLHRRFSRVGFVAEMRKMRNSILYRKEEGLFSPDAYDFGSPYQFHPTSSANPSSSSSYRRQRFSDPSLTFSEALERLDEIIRSPDSEAALCKDLDDAVKFHSQVLEDLLVERKSRAPIRWILSDVVSNRIGSRLDTCSTSTRNSEFSMIWLSLFCKCEKDSDVPLKLLKCDEETIKNELFSADDGMQAAILIGDPSNCESLFGLAALVVFDKIKYPQGSCQTTFHLYSYPRTSDRISQQEEWLLQWKGVHGVELELEKKELIVWGHAGKNLSSLGLGLMSCLCTLIEHRCQSVEHGERHRTAIFRTELMDQLTVYQNRMGPLGQRTDDTLLCDTLSIDSCLREIQRDDRNPEYYRKLEALLEKFHEERLRKAKSDFKEQLSFIERKISSSDWESTSIAYGFLDLFERLKAHPDQAFVIEMRKLDSVIRMKFEGLFEAADFLKPILKAKEFIIQYAATRLDTGDDSLCSEFPRMLEFVPEAVEYFVGLLQQSTHSDVMVLDKEKELAIFDTWKQKYTDLIKKLNIPRELLHRNGLENVFGEMKRMYKQLKEIKDRSFLVDRDANWTRNRQEPGLSSQSKRVEYEIKRRKKKYQDLWQEAKKNPRQTSAIIMREAIKTCKELDRLDPATCSRDVLDRYEDKLNSLFEELNKPMLDEESEKHFSVTQESKELKIMYDSCLRESSFAPVSNSPSIFAETGWRDMNPMNELEKCLTEELDRPEDTEKFLEQLMSWMQSCQHQALSKKAAEIIRHYKGTKDQKEKAARVMELSRLHVFSDNLELQLTFEASKQEKHDVFIDAALDELIIIKARYLLGPYQELLKAWRAEDMKNGIKGLLNTCSGKRLTVLHAISTFEKLREHATRLRTRLASHSSMASADFSFLCPELTEDDVAVIFSFNRSVAYDCITHQTTSSPSLHVDGSGGLLALHSLPIGHSMKAQIFKDFAKEMNTAVKALKDRKWHTVLERNDNQKEQWIDNQKEQSILREIVIAFQFVWLSVCLSHTDFVQFVKEIQLSSKEKVQKEAADLDARYSALQKRRRKLIEQMACHVHRPSTIILPRLLKNDTGCEEIDRTEKELQQVEEKLKENKDAIDRQKKNLCTTLSIAFRKLAQRGLDLCTSMLGTKPPELYEMLSGEINADQEAEEIDADQKAVEDVYMDIGRQAKECLTENRFPDETIENELDEWTQELEDFCTQDLCSLEKGNPVREAIRDVCTLLSIGNERILYLLRAATKLVSMEGQSSPHRDSEKLREKWEALREACADPVANGDGIRELCMNLLMDESKYRERKEGCIGKPDAIASASYTQNLILSTVSLCCSKIDSIEKTDLYVSALLPRVQEAEKEGHFQPLPLNDASELRRVFESVQCIWHNLFLSTERTVDECLADPFELLWNIETFLTKHGPLYASVSYTSRLCIQGLRDVVKRIINDSRVLTSAGQKEEQELLQKVKDVLLKACRQRPTSLQINEMQDVFKELKHEFSELTEVMLQHRQRPGPFLVDFLTRALDHWWFESAECCMRSLRDSNRHGNPVGSNVKKAKSGGGIIMRAPLEEFLHPLHLQRECLGVKAEGSVGVSSLSDRELIDRLHAISVFVNQLPASAGQKLFEWWKTCSVLKSSSALIEKSVVLLNAHGRLMKQTAELVLQLETDNKETTAALDEACAILQCLHTGIHKDMTAFLEKNIKDDKELSDIVKNLAEKFGVHYTTCKKGFDDLIQEQPLMRNLIVEDIDYQMEEWMSPADNQVDYLTLLKKRIRDCYLKAWRQFGVHSRILINPSHFPEFNDFVNMSSLMHRILKSRGQQRRQRRLDTLDVPFDDGGVLRRIVVKITLRVSSISPMIPDSYFRIYSDENGVTRGHHDVSIQTFSEASKEISYEVNDEKSFRLIVVYHDTKDDHPRRYTLRELDSGFMSHECKPLEYGPGFTFVVDITAIYMGLEALEMCHESPSRGSIRDYASKLKFLVESYEEEYRRCPGEAYEPGYDDSYAFHQPAPSRRLEDEHGYHQAHKQFRQVEEWSSAIRNLNDAVRNRGMSNFSTFAQGRLRIEQAAEALSKAVRERSRISSWKMSTNESNYFTASSSCWRPEVQKAFEEIQSIVFQMEECSRRALQTSYLKEFCRSCLKCLRSPTEHDLDLFDTSQLELTSRMRQCCLQQGEKDLIEFKTSNWLKAVNALAQAEVKWSGCFSDLFRRTKDLESCRSLNPDYLSETNLSNIAKIVIISSGSGGFMLSDAKKEIDFGTLLHARDVSKKNEGQNRIYTLEIVNRSSSNLKIHITPEDPESPCFVPRITESIQLCAETSKNLEFTLRDMADGEILETWCIADSNEELNAKFDLKVNIQRLAIQLSLSRMNFGIVRTGSEAQTRSVSVKNMTTLPVLVKSQIQHMHVTSSLSLQEPRMILHPGQEKDFTVCIKPGMKEESVDTLLVIGAMQNYRYLPLTVQIKKPHFELYDNHHQRIGDTWCLSDIKVRRTVQRSFRIKNVGRVPVVFELRINSPNVKLYVSRGTVHVGKTHHVWLSISHDKEGQFIEELKICVEGAASRGLRISASWQDPTPSFEKQKVVFGVDPKKLASLIKESETKELRLTSSNILVHKQMAVTVYPPKSEDFQFDQEEYHLDKGSEQKFHMTWTVKQLKESEHRIVFVTETRKEISFVVCLQPPADFAFDVAAQDWQVIQNWKPQNAPLLLFNVATDSPFSIVTTRPSSICCESALLRNSLSNQTRTQHEKGPWIFGADDIPREFRPINNGQNMFDVRLKVGESSGWIVENVLVKSRDKILLHENPAKCEFLQRKIAIVGSVSDPHASSELLNARGDDTIDQHERGANFHSSSLPRILPIAKLICQERQSASEQMALLQMLCELEMLESDWVLTGETAKEILRKTVESAVRICDENISAARSGSDKRSSSSSLNWQFSDLREAYILNKKTALDESFVKAVEELYLIEEKQALAQAIYVVMHTTCPEEQQWKAAVALLRASLSDTASSLLMDKACDQIYSAIQNGPLTFAGCVKWLRSMPLADDSPLAACELLDGILAVCQGSPGGGEKLSQSIETCLHYTQLNACFASALNSHTAAREEMLIQLVEADQRDALNKACSNDAWNVLHGFCRIALRCNPPSPGLVLLLMEMLSKEDIKNSEFFVKSDCGGEVLKQTAKSMLRTCGMSDIFTPLWQLHGTLDLNRKRFLMREIVMTAFFAVLQQKCEMDNATIYSMKGKAHGEEMDVTLTRHGHIGTSVRRVPPSYTARSHYRAAEFMSREAVMIQDMKEMDSEIETKIFCWFDYLKSITSSEIDNKCVGQEQKRRSINGTLKDLQTALTVLKLGQFQSGTHPWVLLARIYQFASTLNGEGEDYMIVNILSSFSSKFSREDVMLLCRSLVGAGPKSESLRRILMAVERRRTEKGNVSTKMDILRILHSEDRVNEMLATIGQFIETGEVDLLDGICLLLDCEAERQSAFRSLGAVIRAKNAICSQGSVEESSLGGAQKIEDLTKAVSHLGEWGRYRKRSQSVLSIFFNIYALALAKNKSPTASAISKIAVLTSLFRFYGGPWREKDAVAIPDSNTLEFEKAVPPEMPVTDENLKTEDLPDTKSAELGSSAHNPSENALEGEEEEEEENKQCWLLDNVQSPSGTKKDQGNKPSERPARHVRQSDGVPPEVDSGRNLSEQLKEVENVMKEIHQSIDSEAQRGSSTCRVLRFENVIDFLVKLKKAAIIWTLLFEASVCKSKYAAESEVENLQSAILCSGIDVISVFRFLEQYLESCTLFTMPDAFVATQDSVLEYLNIIPREDLQRLPNRLLQECGSTTIAKENTTDDFIMPSIYRRLGRQGNYGRWMDNPYTRPGMSLYPGLSGRAFPSSTLQGRPAYHRKMMEDLDNYEKEKSLERQRNILEFDIDLGTDAQIHHLRNEYADRRDSCQEDIVGDSDVKFPKHIDASKKNDEDQERDGGRGLIGDAEHGYVQESTAANDMVDFEGDLSAQQRLLDKTYDDEEMVRIFKDAKEINAKTTGKTLDGPVKLDPSANRKSTYEKLLENEGFIRMLIPIMQQCQKCFEQFYQTTVEMRRIEWCILVDNSGSMRCKSIEMNVALVLTMEILRRMEQPFAVTRFGDRNSQQMLKMITDHFTEVMGQKVIESFSYDQGTYIATAIANAAETVWPTSSSEDEGPQCHRVMFLITDGITQERKRHDYKIVCKRKSIALVVLNLANEAQREIMDTVQGLWGYVALNFQVLDVGQEFISLPACISEMIKAVLDAYWKPTKKNDTESSDVSHSGTDDWFSDLRLDINCDAVLSNLGERQQPDNKPGLRREDFYDCDYQPDAVPYTIKMTQMITKNPEFKEEWAENIIDNWQTTYNRLLASPEQVRHSKTAAAAWMRAEDRLSVDIERMTEALEDFLPQNVSARKRPDIKGPSIHLPGFIKHLATKGSEKKIFASRKGGGKSEYSVAIVLDISVSMMHGRKQACVFETVLLLIGALKQMNLESFTLLLFGDDFFPVKLADVMWEDVSIAAFISLVKQRHEPATKDADALLLAERLLDRSDCRGAKKIIVLTDGYGSTGIRLAASLQKLEESGIDVLAIDVGAELSFVKKCYNKWITAALPQLVPDALASVMDKVEISRLHESSAAATTDEGVAMAMLLGNQSRMEELLVDQECLFPELQKMLKAKKEFLKDRDGSGPSSFSIDICFVMDCTSSMDDLIETAIEQVEVRTLLHP